MLVSGRILLVLRMLLRMGVVAFVVVVVMLMHLLLFLSVPLLSAALPWVEVVLSLHPRHGN